jgi:cyclophilin family peptidyl-prolyl cis-trans isomerase
MEFEFWSDVAPKTVENFKSLAKTGYFDGQAFHRIIKGGSFLSASQHYSIWAWKSSIVATYYV